MIHLFFILMSVAAFYFMSKIEAPSIAFFIIGFVAGSAYVLSQWAIYVKNGNV